MRRFVSPSVLASVSCLLLTLFVVLPHISDIAVFFASSPDRTSGDTVLPLNAAPADISETPRENSKVEPLETVEETVEYEPEKEWETPVDIVQLRDTFLKEAEGKTARGTVQERFFVNDGATDVIGKVAVRDCAEEHHPDFAALLREGANLNVENKADPLVLIFHTHTTESFLPAYTGSFYESAATRSEDPAKNMVRVGDAICEELEKHGVGFIHDTEIYDASYDGAYARSRKAVLAYLEQYPSVKIVLDVHRDAIYLTDSLACKPTAQINGRKAAQIMIITGVQEGPVTDFPGWEDNLRFALSLQNAAQQKYEGLMKPIYFCRRKYNMDVVPCGLLLEFGSDTNTLEEAVYSGRLFGNVLSELIEKYE